MLKVSSTKFKRLRHSFFSIYREVIQKVQARTRVNTSAGQCDKLFIFIKIMSFFSVKTPGDRLQNNLVVWIQSNLALRTPLCCGQFVWSQKYQKSYIPYLCNTDTSVKRTLGSVPLVSVLNRFHCSENKNLRNLWITLISFCKSLSFKNSRNTLPQKSKRVRRLLLLSSETEIYPYFVQRNFHDNVLGWLFHGQISQFIWLNKPNLSCMTGLEQSVKFYFHDMNSFLFFLWRRFYIIWYGTFHSSIFKNYDYNVWMYILFICSSNFSFWATKL